jgi:hypothetical protein
MAATTTGAGTPNPTPTPKRTPANIVLPAINTIANSFVFIFLSSCAKEECKCCANL